MSDIFVSYSSGDREFARRFAEGFATQGLSVWWDREIALGTEFDRVIETALNSARCVLVLWSRRSVESSWVRAEAGDGRERGVLVPVLIDAGCPVPLVFRSLQTCNMAHWQGDTDDPAFGSLVQAVRAVVARQIAAAAGATGLEGSGLPNASNAPNGPNAPNGKPGQIAPVAPKAWHRHRGVQLALGTTLLLAPPMLALLGAVMASRHTVATAFDVDLRVRALSLVSGQDEPAMLTARTSVLDLSALGLASVQLSGEGLPTGGAPLVATDPAHAAAIAEGQAPGADAMADVDPLALPARSRLDIAVDKETPPGLRLQWVAPANRTIAKLRRPIALQLTGLPKQADLLLSPGADGGRIEFQGGPAGTTLVLRPAAREAVFAAEALNLKLAKLGLTELDATGRSVSTVVGTGTISYTGLSKLPPPFSVSPGEFVVIENMTNFYLRHIEWLPAEHRLRVLAGGVAESLRYGPAGTIRQRALTALDAARAEPHPALAVAALVLLGISCAGGWLLRQALRRPAQRGEQR